MFVDTSSLLHENGGGHANIVGATDPEDTGTLCSESRSAFGSFTVQGGTDSVMVFGSNNSSAF